MSTLKTELTKYLEVRTKLIHSIEQLNRICNKISQSRKEETAGLLTDLVDISRFQLLTNVDFVSVTNQIEAHQRDYHVILKSIEALKPEINKLTEFDETYLMQVLRQLFDQMMLELVSTDSLINTNNSNNDNELHNFGGVNASTSSSLDYDLFVTVLACFHYPPYVNVSELEAIIKIIKSKN